MVIDEVRRAWFVERETPDLPLCSYGTRNHEEDDIPAEPTERAAQR